MTSFFRLTNDRVATCGHCGNHAWLPVENDRSDTSRRLGAWCSSACARALNMAKPQAACDARIGGAL